MFIIVGWIHFAPATELAILLVERIYAHKKISTTFNRIHCTSVTENILRYVLECNTQHDSSKSAWQQDAINEGAA